MDAWGVDMSPVYSLRSGGALGQPLVFGVVLLWPLPVRCERASSGVSGSALKAGASFVFPGSGSVPGLPWIRRCTPGLARVAIQRECILILAVSVFDSCRCSTDSYAPGRWYDQCGP